MALNFFFSGRGVQPGFLKCKVCKLIIFSERRVSCELKISKFGGLRAKIWAKIEVVEAKIQFFPQKGACELNPEMIPW